MSRNIKFEIQRMDKFKEQCKTCAYDYRCGGNASGSDCNCESICRDCKNYDHKKTHDFCYCTQVAEPNKRKCSHYKKIK